MTQNNLKTVDLVEKLREALNCNKKSLAIMLGVTPTTLSNNIEKPWAEVRDGKFGKHLLSLLYVVEVLQKDSTLDPTTINKVLLTARYQLADGNIVDVLTAVRIDQPKELLVEIADKALVYLRSKYNKEKRPSEDAFYFKAIAN